MNSNDPLNQLFAAYVMKVGPDLSKTEMNAADQSFLYLNGFNFVYWPANAQSSVPTTYQALANGVKQLAGISHLGPAIASLIEIYAKNKASKSTDYEDDLAVLLSGVIVSQKANSADYWEAIDPIVLHSYATKMAGMIDEGLKLVRAYLEKAMDNPDVLNYKDFISKVLNPKGAKYSFNQVMIGTFSLANLLVQYHSIQWMEKNISDWTKCSVLFGGQFGRATGGLTIDTNTAVGRLIVASKQTLDPSNILIAPASPDVDTTQTDPTYWTGIKTKVQNTWWLTHSSSSLSAKMFSEYKTIKPQKPQVLPPDSSEKPPFDQFMERLRFALENPDQELASCTAGFMADALGKNKFSPDGLFIPGMDHS